MDDRRCKAVLRVNYSAQIRIGMRCPDPALPGIARLCWLHAAAERSGQPVRLFPFKNPALVVGKK